MKGMRTGALCLAFGVLPAAGGAQQFNVVNLGTLGGNSSSAQGINDNGVVVGYSYFAGNGIDRRAFKWTPNGGMQHLFGFQSEADDVANDINNSNVAIGTVIDGSTQRAVKWAPGQPTQYVGIPGNHNIGRDINNAGNAAGTYYVNTYAQASFVMGNQAWTMPLQGNQDGSIATAINNLNMVAGYRFTSNPNYGYEAVIWNPFGGVTGLGTLGGLTYASNLNDLNHVTGESDLINGDEHAFFWSQDVGMLSIHGLAERNSSTGEAINNKGAIVGRAHNGGYLDAVGFIWTADAGMRSLDTLLDIESQGWHIIEATDINEHGQIVGLGNHALYGTRAILLNPVPEPGTIAVIGIGALALLRRKRKVH